jgi:hypothetical protein
MAFDIKAWTDYGVAVVGGAATLTGLLFVAVSVNSAWFNSSEGHRGRAGQALVLFVVPLVSGILLVIPGQSPTSLGIEIVVFGVLVGRVLLALGTDPAERRATIVGYGRRVTNGGRLGEGWTVALGAWRGRWFRIACIVRHSTRSGLSVA